MSTVQVFFLNVIHQQQSSIQDNTRITYDFYYHCTIIIMNDIIIIFFADKFARIIFYGDPLNGRWVVL